eukprot:9035627-Pyramimonas_sp.AAC.1
MTAGVSVMNKNYTIRDVVFPAGANVVVFPGQGLDGLWVSGDAVEGPANRRGGRGEAKGANRMREMYCMASLRTAAGFKLRLTNTYGTRTTTWRHCTHTYEPVYDYLAVPADWAAP